MTEEERALFYILDTRGSQDTALWWKPQGAGYTTNLDEAGVYTEEQIAQRSLPRSQVAVPIQAAIQVSNRAVAARHLGDFYEKGRDPPAPPEPDTIINGFNYGKKKADGQYERYPTAVTPGVPFVRPVRTDYKHVGIRPKHPTRPLTAEEEERYKDYGYLFYEDYGTEEGASGRFWTKEQLNSGCGAITTMGLALAQTYAQKPSFYGATFCVGCHTHHPVEQFVWMHDHKETTERVGS